MRNQPAVAVLARRAGLAAMAFIALTAVVDGQPTTARPASQSRIVPPEAFTPFVLGSPSPSAVTPSSPGDLSTTPPRVPTLVVRPKPPVRLTPPAGPVHVVRAGDTLWQIARWHRVSLEVVVRWNPTVAPFALALDTRIAVPGGAAMPTRSTVRARTVAAAPRPNPAIPVGRRVWPMPVRGMITTRFSSAHPGIDIAAPAGTIVRAIAAGTVVFSGWKDNGGGYVVVLRHPGGLISTYNHNQSLAVRPGQQVAAAQAIARVGSTGRSTGPHLDLRVEIGGRFVNPLTLF